MAISRNWTIGIAIAMTIVVASQGVRLTSAQSRIEQLLGIADSQGELLLALQEQINAHQDAIEHLIRRQMLQHADSVEHAI